jgi:hypothetical protein
MQKELMEGMSLFSLVTMNYPAAELRGITMMNLIDLIPSPWGEQIKTTPCLPLY